MNRDFGWWKTLPRERTLLNRASGQRVRRIGPSQEADALAEDGWWRFEYEDEEGAWFSILAKQESGSILKPGDDESRRRDGQVLAVDYGRSAALWRREVGTGEDHPPYGLWRRVDDCITDALPCWPRMTSHDHALVRVDFHGGWLNGAWRPDFRRTYPALDRAAIKRRLAWWEERKRIFEAERPTLLPLDIPAPAPWRFHPFPPKPAPGDEEWLEVSNDVSLANMRNLDGAKRGRPTVPQGFNLTGFEGLTPYMRSADGQRVLFPMEASSLRDWGEMYFTIRYGDEDVIDSVLAQNKGPYPKAPWVFDLNVGIGNPRHEGVAEDIRPCLRQDGRTGRSYGLWQRLSKELVDAWQFWEGTPYRNTRWSAETALAGTESLMIEKNYLGGIWPIGEYFVAWLEGAGQSPFK